MQRESGDLSPFQERVNVSLFFSGAHRRKLLEEIKNEVVSGVPVIVVTGDEGSGKTMVCRMVEKELPAEFASVYLPNTLESFDDVVRVLALGLGTENSKNPGSALDLVFEITEHLQESGRRLVAIFDQAERMYLATLERIRKVLDQINNTEVQFQIVLVGRKMLLENLKQLEICDFKKVKERYFSLGSLGLSETYAYLNHCVQQRSPARGKNVFSPEAAKKIYTMAQGNFRMTNMLAEKSLESFDSETSFMVLLENVHDGGIGKAADAGKYKKTSRSARGGRIWLVGMGGLAVLIVALFYFPDWYNNAEVKVADKNSSVEVVIVQAEKEMVSDTKNEVELPQKPSVNEKKEVNNAKKEDVKPVISIHSPETMEKIKTEGNIGDTGSVTKDVMLSLQADEGKKNPLQEVEPAEVELITENKVQDGSISGGKAIESVKENKIVQKDEGQEIKAQSVESLLGGGAVSAENISSDSKPTITPLLAEAVNSEENNVDHPPSQTSEQQDESEDTVVVDAADEDLVILSDNNKRIPPAKQPEAEGKKIIQIAPVTVKTPDPEVVDYSKQLDELETVDQLYQRRVDAASSWLYGIRDDKHTVQLMMLTSEQAEENLKNRFEQEEYRNIADQLYIIKNTNESTVFVYYGEYPDSDSARKIRNTLPVFLRKHNPYAISVENAVRKATSQ